jgi:hypothetical protein
MIFHDFSVSIKCLESSIQSKSIMYTIQQFPLSCRSVPNGVKFALDSAGSGHPEQFFASNGKRHCNVPWITAIQLSFGPHEADIMGLDTLS